MDKQQERKYTRLSDEERERQEQQDKYLMMWELGVPMHRQAGVTQYTFDTRRVISSIRGEK